MGRELKRVALDFEWPLNKVWKGFINPFYTAKKCAHCENGYSAEAKALMDKWYGYGNFKPEDRGSKPITPDNPLIQVLAKRNLSADPSFYGTSSRDLLREATRLCDLFNPQWMHHLNQDDVDALVADGRLMDLTHTCKDGEGWKKIEPPVIPTAQEVNEWSLLGFGHDSINQWICVNAECKRLGVSNTCEHCGGTGEYWETPEEKEAYDNWKDYEPPEGEGYQIWETVSEGSPISPVFSTPEDLAKHMATTSWGVDKGTSAETWLKFIMGPGWSPSMIVTGGKMYVNAECANIPKEG